LHSFDTTPKTALGEKDSISSYTSGQNELVVQKI